MASVTRARSYGPASCLSTHSPSRPALWGAQVMCIWEVIWCQHRTDEFSLFVCAAMIEVYAKPQVPRCNSTDEVMEFFNNLAGRMAVSEVLNAARALLYRFRHIEPPPGLEGLWKVSSETRSRAASERGKRRFVPRSTAWPGRFTTCSTLPCALLFSTMPRLLPAAHCCAGKHIRPKCPSDPCSGRGRHPL